MTENKENKQNWTITIEEDPETGDLVMPFPTDCLNQVGWDVGDTLIWEEMQNGSWHLRKKEEELPRDDSN